MTENKAVQLIRLTHGRWVKTKEGGALRLYCSVCRTRQPVTMASKAYCPDCGARMDGEETASVPRPCDACPEGKTGKTREYCKGCIMWREWFKAAWEENAVTKETLRQYRWMLSEIRALKEEIWRIESMAATRTRLTGLPGGSGVSDQTARAALELSELSEMLEDKARRLLCLRAEIEDALAALPPSDRILIRERYFEGKSWKEIAALFHYSYQHVLKLHGKILQKLKRG